MNLFQLIQTALTVVVFPALWWLLRKQGKATEAVKWATIARDTLAAFLEAGVPFKAAQAKTLEALLKQGVPSGAAGRIVAGAAASLR